MAFSQVQQFWMIVGERKQSQFDEWLKSAKHSGIVELRYFAHGLEKDLQAVEAALVYGWSNEPVEGHNNRLKMIKRQMYARANFDLLKQRVLYSPSLQMRSPEASLRGRLRFHDNCRRVTF